jgi:hypothetical protein
MWSGTRQTTIGKKYFRVVWINWGLVCSPVTNIYFIKLYNQDILRVNFSYYNLYIMTLSELCLKGISLLSYLCSRWLASVQKLLNTVVINIEYSDWSWPFQMTLRDFSLKDQWALIYCWIGIFFHEGVCSGWPSPFENDLVWICLKSLWVCVNNTYSKNVEKGTFSK